MANSMIYGITLSAIDRSSGVIGGILKSVANLSDRTNQANERMQRLGTTSLTEANANMTELAETAGKLSGNMGEANNLVESFAAKLGNSRMVAAGLATILAGVTLTAIKGLVSEAIKATDEFSRMYARLNMVNDGQQTTEQLNQAIYRSAQLTRSEYKAVADQVGKLGMLASNAFGSTAEIVDFVTEMNRQFKLGGAGIQEQTAAMYQLTQAMASGRLQGDEFRSIIENAPLLAQAITKYMGVSQAELKKLASEGAITSDVIKNALKMSASESADAFGKLPVTFAEHMTTLENATNIALAPLKQMLADIFSSPEFIQAVAFAANLIVGTIKFVVGFIQLLRDVWNGVAGAARFAWGVIETGANIVAGLFPPIVTAVEILGEYLAALVGIGLTWLGVLAAKSIAVGIYSAMAGGATVITGLWTLAQKALNMAMLRNPIGIVIAVIAALIVVIYNVVDATIGWRNVFVAVWETAVDVVQWAVNNMIKRLNFLLKIMNAVGEGLSKVFGTKYTPVSMVDNVDFSGMKKRGTEIIKSFKWGFGDWTTLPGMAGASGLPPVVNNNEENSVSKQIVENTGRTADNTAQAKDLLELTQDEIDRMRNVADKEAIARYTNQEIKIVVTNNNQVSSDADIDGMGDSIARQLMRALRAAPEGV